VVRWPWLSTVVVALLAIESGLRADAPVDVAFCSTFAFLTGLGLWMNVEMWLDRRQREREQSMTANVRIVNEADGRTIEFACPLPALRDAVDKATKRE
jgi:hypothetical protein